MAKLINPSHPIIDRWAYTGTSDIAHMFADWCTKQGAQTEIEEDDGLKFVTATRGDTNITAAFDAFDGRFTRDGFVATRCEFGSVTTLKDLANALLTGHRKGGHR